MNHSVKYTAAALVVVGSVVKVLNHYNVVVPLSAQEIVDAVSNALVLAAGLIIMIRRYNEGDINLLGRKK